VTPALIDTNEEILYISDITYPDGVTTSNLEGTIATYIDVSSIVPDATVVQPFGSVATMDVGDALFLHPFLATAVTAYSRIYVDVSTAGVGTWAISIKRYNATTDFWETQTITTDNTNAFRTAGVNYIEFTSTVHGATRLQQSDSVKNYWTKIELVSLTSVTTAPAIDAIWTKTSGTGINIFGTVTAGLLTIFSSNVFVSGSSYFLATSDTAPVGWNVVSKNADDFPVTYKWQYYNSSSVWTDLTTVRDETGGFDTAVTNAEIRWAIPTDWTSMTLTLTSDDTGTTVTRTGYLHRMIPVSPSTSVVQVVGEAVINFVKLGSANSSGIPLNAGTIDYLTYEIYGTTSTSDVVLGLTNSTTGTMSTATIAANRSSSFDDTNHKLDITNLALADNDELMVFHLSGGNLSDIELRLHTA